MTTLKRGSIVLVPFPFTNLSAIKRRPALVISSDEYNAVTGDAIIAQITSKLKSPARPGDYQVKEWQSAGLLVASLVRARMTTLHSSIVVKVLGVMSESEMQSISRSLDAAIAIC